MRSKRWKWIGLGAVAAIAAGTVLAAERRRRRWREYDTDQIRTRLHERFAAIGPETDVHHVASTPEDELG